MKTSFIILLLSFMLSVGAAKAENTPESIVYINNLQTSEEWEKLVNETNTQFYDEYMIRIVVYPHAEVDAILLSYYKKFLILISNEFKTWDCFGNYTVCEYLMEEQEHEH